MIKTIMYKIRKFLGLTLFEDAIKDIKKEEKEEFKKRNKDKKDDHVDWVTSSSFTGM